MCGILCLCCSSVAFSAVIQWNYLARTGWGDAVMGDGDEHGNSNVWYYQYGPSTSFDPADFNDLTAWNGDYWHPGDTYPYSRFAQVHPDFNQSVMIRFISPVSANFDINVSLTNAYNNTASDGQIFHILKETSLEYSVENARGDSKSISVNVDIAAGESLYVIIDPKTQASWDVININSFTLTGDTEAYTGTVPEPASIVLLIASLAGLVRRKLRR